MEVTRQLTEIADRAEDFARQASQTEPGKAARQITERVESVIAPRSTNAVWRSLLLSLAGASLLTSLGMMLAGKKHASLFAGQMVQTLLIAALWGQTVRAE